MRSVSLSVDHDETRRGLPALVSPRNDSVTMWRGTRTSMCGHARVRLLTMPTYAVLAALITRRPLCLECIAANMEMTLRAADKAVMTIANTLSISAEPGSRCLACGGVKITFCIGGRPRS